MLHFYHSLSPFFPWKISLAFPAPSVVSLLWNTLIWYPCTLCLLLLFSPFSPLFPQHWAGVVWVGCLRSTGDSPRTWALPATPPSGSLLGSFLSRKKTCQHKGPHRTILVCVAYSWDGNGINKVIDSCSYYVYHEVLSPSCGYIGTLYLSSVMMRSKLSMAKTNALSKELWFVLLICFDEFCLLTLSI